MWHADKSWKLKVPRRISKTKRPGWQQSFSTYGDHSYRPGLDLLEALSDLLGPLLELGIGIAWNANLGNPWFEGRFMSLCLVLIGTWWLFRPRLGQDEGRQMETQIPSSVSEHPALQQNASVVFGISVIFHVTGCQDCVKQLLRIPIWKPWTISWWPVQTVAHGTDSHICAYNGLISGPFVYHSTHWDTNRLDQVCWLLFMFAGFFKQSHHPPGAPYHPPTHPVLWRLPGQNDCGWVVITFVVVDVWFHSSKAIMFGIFGDDYRGNQPLCYFSKHPFCKFHVFQKTTGVNNMSIESPRRLANVT